MNTPEEFWAHVKRGDGCWEWQGSRFRGYGKTNYDGALVQTHRLAWTLTNGPIPAGMLVCHHCDNRACAKTQPDERYPDGNLFLGTHADNSRDAVNKGRQAHGERHGLTSMTNAQAVAVYKCLQLGISRSVIAQETGLAASVIESMRKGRTWRLVTGAAARLSPACALCGRHAAGLGWNDAEGRRVCPTCADQHGAVNVDVVRCSRRGIRMTRMACVGRQVVSLDSCSANECSGCPLGARVADAMGITFGALDAQEATLSQ